MTDKEKKMLPIFHPLPIILFSAHLTPPQTRRNDYFTLVSRGGVDLSFTITMMSYEPYKFQGPQLKFFEPNCLVLNLH
jgi:hypothetical protein